MEKKIKRAVLWTLVFITAILTLLLTNQFFQQDEWHSFGLIQAYDSGYLTLEKPLWESILSDRIGARALMFSSYKTFGINPLPYGIFAAGIHILNTFLVFYLTFVLTKKRPVASITALFFLVNSVGYQAYSWFGTMMGSAVSVSFILISFICYIVFLQQKKYTLLFLSVITIFISFLFKELAISLLFLYPLLWVINPYNKKTIRSFILENSIFLLYGIVMTALLAYVVISIPGERANYIEAENSGYLRLVQHAVVYSFQGIIQPFIPYQIVFEAARWLTILFVPSLTPETSQFDAFYQTRMTEGIVVFLAALFLGGSFYFYRKVLRNASRELRFTFIASFIFLISSYTPYIVLDKFDAYLDSRYYYNATVAVSLMTGIFAYCLYMATQNYAKRRIILIGFLLLFVSHTSFLFSDLFNQYRVSRERQSIIQQIKTHVPSLDKNTVFFITGNSPGYYGIPELKVPFQSGLGQILTTIYIFRRQLSSKIFLENTFTKTLEQGFLYDTLAQGYKKINSQGFGYYYDKELLFKDISAGRFEENDVVSLFYNSDTGKIEKISLN